MATETCQYEKMRNMKVLMEKTMRMVKRMLMGHQSKWRKIRERGKFPLPEFSHQSRASE